MDLPELTRFWQKGGVRTRPHNPAGVETPCGDPSAHGPMRPALVEIPSAHGQRCADGGVRTQGAPRGGCGDPWWGVQYMNLGEESRHKDESHIGMFETDEITAASLDGVGHGALRWL